MPKVDAGGTLVAQRGIRCGLPNSMECIMARADPAEQALIRLELRRFASRCDLQEGQLRRADTLREVARLAGIALPYKLSNEVDARDYQRRVAQTAEERARELIDEQVSLYIRSEGEFKEKLRGKMRDDWANLTGPLAHLRSWANNKLLVADQNA
jgi:hypothetical protein